MGDRARTLARQKQRTNRSRVRQRIAKINRKASVLRPLPLPVAEQLPVKPIIARVNAVLDAGAPRLVADKVGGANHKAGACRLAHVVARCGESRTLGYHPRSSSAQPLAALDEEMVETLEPLQVMPSVRFT